MRNRLLGIAAAAAVVVVASVAGDVVVEGPADAAEVLAAHDGTTTVKLTQDDVRDADLYLKAVRRYLQDTCANHIVPTVNAARGDLLGDQATTIDTDYCTSTVSACVRAEFTTPHIAVVIPADLGQWSCSHYDTL